MNNANRLAGVMALLVLGVGVAPAQDWPQWRGPNRDNKLVGFSEPKTWPKELTKKWKVEVGIGESSPVMVGDRVYTFGRIGGDEVTLCLDAATGKEIWKDKYATAAVTGPPGKFPGTRSTPAVGEGKICTLGANGVVSCLDAASGKLIWRENTPKLKFATSTSPLIADGKCIVFVGNDKAGALNAYDLGTGAIKWSWKGESPPYGSPVLMTADGVKQVVTPTQSNTLVGVSLADGQLLWQASPGGSGYFGNYSTPLVDGQTVYYSATGGKGGGGDMSALKIAKQGDKFEATTVWKNKFVAAGYHTPLYKDGLIFGVQAAGKAYTFFCLDAKTGKELWKDKTNRGECGSILDAGSVLLSLNADKHLVAFKPSKTAFEEIANYTVSTSPTWAVPIIAGNRVYVKDEGGSLALMTIE